MSPEVPVVEQAFVPVAASLRQFWMVMENPVVEFNEGEGLVMLYAVPKNVGPVAGLLVLLQGRAPRKDGAPVAAV